MNYRSDAIPKGIPARSVRVAASGRPCVQSIVTVASLVPQTYGGGVQKGVWSTMLAVLLMAALGAVFWQVFDLLMR